MTDLRARALEALAAQTIELPSWAFGNSGTRFKVFGQPGVARDPFEKLEDDYVAAWKTWPAADRDGRERLWQAVNVLGKVRDHLARVLADGKLAQRELTDLVHKPR